MKYYIIFNNNSPKQMYCIEVGTLKNPEPSENKC